MLDNKSKAIDIVCYFIIFCLAILIIMPPLLRFIMPQGNNYDNTTKLKALRCVYTEESGYEKIIYSQMKNDVYTKVNVTYNNVTDETLLREREFLDVNGVSESVENNTIVYTIEYNDDTKNHDYLKNYFTDMNSLKTTYEANGYGCQIVTN